MNLDDLTLGEIKQLKSLFGLNANNNSIDTNTLNEMIGEKVIIRTYSAGVWFGTLSEKARNEVIIKDARRMWRWWTKESISLSSVAIHGINHDKSKIAQAVHSVWLEAIEIIPCTTSSINSIEGARNAIAE